MFGLFIYLLIFIFTLLESKLGKGIFLFSYNGVQCCFDLLKERTFGMTWGWVKNEDHFAALHVFFTDKAIPECSLIIKNKNKQKTTM